MNKILHIFLFSLPIFALAAEDSSPIIDTENVSLVAIVDRELVWESDARKELMQYIASEVAQDRGDGFEIKKTVVVVDGPQVAAFPLTRHASAENNLMGWEIVYINQNFWATFLKQPTEVLITLRRPEICAISYASPGLDEVFAASLVYHPEAIVNTLIGFGEPSDVESALCGLTISTDYIDYENPQVVVYSEDSIYRKYELVSDRDGPYVLLTIYHDEVEFSKYSMRIVKLDAYDATLDINGFGRGVFTDYRSGDVFGYVACDIIPSIEDAIVFSFTDNNSSTLCDNESLRADAWMPFSFNVDEMIQLHH